MAVQKNFVIRNGIEVNDNLLVADSSINKVGIGTSSPNYTLEVRGGIGVTNFNSLGISTVNDIEISGRVTAGSSLGQMGQYLMSTGLGVTWVSSTTTIRTVDQQTAGVGDSTFSTTYALGLIDVFINGVKLSEDEFTAADEATVILNDPCFGGETVEFVSYASISPGFLGIPPTYWKSSGISIGIHTTSNVGIGTTNPTSTLDVYGDVSVSGIITATNGFISVANTTPVQISLVGNQLTFTAVGIGSTTLTLV